MTASARGILLGASRHPLCRVFNAALDAAGVPQGAAVLLGVSGGVDSTALMVLAAGLARRGRIRPVVAHVDHGLRPESGQEAEAVEEMAQRLGLPAVRLTISLSRGGNLAARARRARYQALAAAAHAQHARWVLTAHQADDQLETMLMSLARGTGLRRMGGMRPRRRLAECAPDAIAPGAGTAPDDVQLLRPLLGTNRSALRQLCQQLGVTWCEDPSNADATRPRGLVRHRVLPLLEEAWPGSPARAGHAALLLQWAAGALRRRANRLMQQARVTPKPRPGEKLANQQGAVGGDTAGDTAGGTAAGRNMAGGTSARREEMVFDRALLRRAPLAVVAELVRLTAGKGGRSVVIWQVARAIHDAQRQPRTWQVSPSCRVRLTARRYSVVPGA